MRAFKNLMIGTALITGLSGPFLQSCKNSKPPEPPKDRISNKIDTLIVEHDECTECLDAYILEGTLNVPDSIGRHYPGKDIYLEGNDPFKNGENLQEKIKMYGYVVKADRGPRGKGLFFWVLDWKIIKKGE
jgi:hypothetical protein